MKAVRLNEWGKALELEDIPQPKPNDDEVLVRSMLLPLIPSIAQCKQAICRAWPRRQ